MKLLQFLPPKTCGAKDLQKSCKNYVKCIEFSLMDKNYTRFVMRADPEPDPFLRRLLFCRIRQLKNNRRPERSAYEINAL